MVNIKFISEVMYYILLAGAIFFFISNPHHLYPFFVLISFFAICNITRSFFKLDETEFFLIVLFFYIASLGECFTLCLYNKFFYYDKFLHFIFFMYLAFVAYNKLKGFGLKEKLFIFSILSVMGIASLVEIYEYIYDVFFNQGMQGVFDSSFHTVMGGLKDTIWDMVSGLIGSLVACSLIYKFRRTEKYKEEKCGHQKESGA